MLLVIDDANWCGSGFRAATLRLVKEIQAVPLLLVIVNRSEDPEDWISAIRRLPLVSVLEPGPLPGSGIAELCDSYGRPDLAGEVVDISGGNPYLASRYLADPDGPGAVPSAVLAWTEDRLDCLDEQTAKVARAMAALGEAGTLADVEAAAGISTDQTLRSIDRLQAAAFLTGESPPRIGPSLLADAVRSSTPAGEAIRLSIVLANRLRERDPVVAAGYLVDARPEGPSPEPWAIDLLRTAAMESREAGDTDQSIDLLRRLIEEPLDVKDRLEALTALGEMEAERRDPAATDHLAQASGLAEDPIVRGQIALVQGRALFHLIALEECSSVCRAAIADLPASERELRLALESAALDAEALLGVHRERPGEMLEEVQQAATPGERLVLTHVLADQAASGGAPAAEIREAGRRILAGGDLLTEAGANSPTYIYLGTALTWAGAYEDVIKLTTEGIRRGREEGLPAAVSYSAALRSGCALLIGDLDLAEFDSALVVTELAGADPMSFAVALAWYLEVLVHRGRTGEARDVLDSSGLTGDLPELGTIDFLMLARGSLLLVEGDTEKALSEFEDVGRRATRATYTNPAAMDWRSRAALAHHELGAIERARELADDELARAEAFGTARSRGVALIAKGSVAPGEEGVGLLEEAVSLLSGVSPVETARATIALGEALHRCGDDSARQVLYRGLSAAQEAGSALLGDRAILSLRATGARPRRRERTGLESLTRQELRAAELAADGLSNPDIAKQMYLTRRTVEMHLSNAYRKLGISNRNELPGVFQSSSP